MMNLHNEFKRIKKNHRRAIRIGAARGVPGPSVMRVYNKGTKEALFSVLCEIDIDELVKISGQEEFKQWFEKELSKLTKVIKSHNTKNFRINPGLKWGHATKILNLYVRAIVLNSRYFSDAQVKRIREWLYIPIDSVVIKRLNSVGISLPFKQIRQIDKAEKFYSVQEKLGEVAQEIGVPRVWFDDNWGNRQ